MDVMDKCQFPPKSIRVIYVARRTTNYEYKMKFESEKVWCSKNHLKSIGQKNWSNNNKMRAGYLKLLELNWFFRLVYLHILS